MALVVAARSPAESAATVAPPRLAPSHARLGHAVVIGSVPAVGIALIVDGAARAMPYTPWLDAANVAVTSIAGAAVLLACLSAWLYRRADSSLLLAATLAPILIALRTILAALLDTLDLSTPADVANSSIGLLVLGALVWMTAAWSRSPNRRPYTARETELFRRVAEVTAFVLFGVSLSGAAVGAVGASWACQGVFPDCNGLGALPFGRDPLADVQLYHRLLSYVVLGLVLWLAIEAFRTQRGVQGLATASVVLLGATLLDAAVGVASVSTGVPVIGEIAHTTVSAMAWSAAIVVVVVARQGKLSPARSPAIARHTGLKTPAAYVQLTKPRVMSLLLATTAAAMVIAARGLPDLGLFLATLLGGALMSGGAGAINHYVDRDIDPLMGRTAWRPIPSGVIAPRHALWFGIVLAVVASAVFAVFVNPLAMVLAQIGLLGYVFIYTLWLKRSTPSNIVIGGAAGAIPPLVGWAAVTHEVSSLTAWYLFAIIFFWTPPHFWALSLLIRQHYERANVPMLPVVRGEQETRRQIILYSLLLVVLTLVLSPFGLMGPVYFMAALVLGGGFIHNAIRLWREATPGAARRLYVYSILYLFALFAAMAVDRVVAS
ncbi:MAG: protoheme IX farnesyltransferase [Chloroflexi bacterium]|nr:protoheme IX farnesyltransferase [Chloroflexota bacterium]